MTEEKIRKLNLSNIDQIISDFHKDVEHIGKSIQGKRGIQLMHSIKRDVLDHGPYPHTSLFEASNRIMTDLVILNGVNYLLRSKFFPFNEYEVEFGNENNNSHDIQSKSSIEMLGGEAFNVAPSFFQTKKTHALNKLKKNSGLTYRVIMFNSDAINDSYHPKIDCNFVYFISVNIFSNNVFLIN
jgi:hypothetical protein